jgi:hypothetical protein
MRGTSALKNETRSGYGFSGNLLPVLDIRDVGFDVLTGQIWSSNAT